MGYRTRQRNLLLYDESTVRSYLLGKTDGRGTFPGKPVGFQLPEKYQGRAGFPGKSDS